MSQKHLSKLSIGHAVPYVPWVRFLPEATHAFWGGLQGWFPDGMEILHVASEPEPEPPSNRSWAKTCQNQYVVPGCTRFCLNMSQGLLFPQEMVFIPTGEKRKQLFCIHPHGIYTLGALALPDHVPEVRLCLLADIAPIFLLEKLKML